MAASSDERAPIITWAHPGYWGRAATGTGEQAADLRFIHRLTARQIVGVLSRICLNEGIGGDVHIPDGDEAMVANTRWLPIRAGGQLELGDRRLASIRDAVGNAGLTASGYSGMQEGRFLAGDAGAVVYDAAEHLGVRHPGALLSFGLVLCEPGQVGFETYPPARSEPMSGEIAELVQFYPGA